MEKGWLFALVMFLVESALFLVACILLTLQRSRPRLREYVDLLALALLVAAAGMLALLYPVTALMEYPLPHANVSPALLGLLLLSAAMPVILFVLEAREKNR